MRITVLGAGAMGCLFGGILSQNNDVVLIDVNKDVTQTIQSNGIFMKEKDGTERHFTPKAVSDSSVLSQSDLVILFVKSMYSELALSSNRNLIGKDTYLMTLQNGAGHENTLLKFTDKEHVIIGSTQHNSSVLGLGRINHGGTGPTFISVLGGNGKRIYEIADSFCSCGIECSVSEDVRYQIWHKLFTNTSASLLTGILQVPLGFVGKDKYANFLMHALAKEAVATAGALGLKFSEEKIIAEVQSVCDNAPNGYTSIYADLRDGRLTEVDTISGCVVRCAHEKDIDVPYHEMAVALVHAMENKNKEK